MFQILVVEDETDICQLFCRTLEKNEYTAIGAANAKQALSILEETSVDLVITDIMMPGMDGFSFVRELRGWYPDLPVLIITAKSDILDKEKGFSAGADDYMVKPIHLDEMVLRVHALLRRSKSVSEKRLEFGDTTLEYTTWTVTDANGEQTLPKKEFQLLYQLLSYPGRIFTRQQLLDEIWGFHDYVDPHTLDVHISRLRERFRDNEDFEIVTIRGLGYKAVQK